MKWFKEISLENMSDIVDYLYPKLHLGTIVFLEGQLGAGKTTLVQLLAKRLGVKEKIVSPTFTIAKPYSFDNGEIIHIDAYRLSNTLDDQQWIEMCDDSNVCFIEWPTHLKSSKFLNAIHIFIDITSLTTRTIQIRDANHV